MLSNGEPGAIGPDVSMNTELGFQSPQPVIDLHLVHKGIIVSVPI